jgi:hypothetical protein
MTVPMILLPVFVLVALHIALALMLFVERNRVLYSGKLKIRDIALTRETWPERAKQLGNAFQNQFEFPILFYILVGFALITRKADLVFVVLSWLFVLSRFVHAYIHVTSNRVPRRFLAFLFGVIVLVIMWAMFAIQIMTGA